MNYIYCVLCLIFSVSAYSETLSVTAESDMKKGEQIDATAIFDGDTETTWSETFNKKMTLFIMLSKQKPIEELEIIWGDEFAEEIELEFKVRGGWKGPDKIEGKQNSDATYFNLEKKRGSKFIRISLKANDGPKLITIKEIKINGESSTLSTVKNPQQNKPVETSIEEEKPAELSKSDSEPNSDKDSKKKPAQVSEPKSKSDSDPNSDKASGDQPIHIKKDRNKIYI